MTPRPLAESGHDLSARVREAENRIIAISGLDGSNGKLGTLAAKVEEDRSNRRGWALWIAGIAVTALVTGGGALYVAGTRDGDTARALATAIAETERLHSQVNDLSSEVASLQIDLATLRAMTLAPRRNGGRP
jgi:outer membrane murein-binding lipoprotein Lpp